MQALGYFIKLVVLFGPAFGVWFYGYAKWRREYDSNLGLLDYLSRFQMKRWAKDDTFGIFVLKAIIVVPWTVVMLEVLFP